MKERVIGITLSFNNNSKEHLIIIPAFSLKKRVYQFRVKVGPSSVRLSITFLVNVSPPKPLEVATSIFVVEKVT